MNKLIVYVVIERRRLENNVGGDTDLGRNKAVGESMRVKEEERWRIGKWDRYPNCKGEMVSFIKVC